MTQKYFAIPTVAGEAAIANAQLTGKALKYTHMSVGDGGGDNAAVPTPNREQKTLLGERRRVQINRLFRDPTNSALLIIEAVLPSDIGGWWIRELGVWDESGQLSIVANCAPSFKPLLSEGAARDQVLRIALVVSGQVPIELKIDPAVVLATRGYVDAGLDKKLDKNGTAVAASKLATPREIAVSGDLTGSVSFDGTKDVSFTGTLAKSGVAAGTYGNANTIAVVTVDEKGRVTKADQAEVGNAKTATRLAAARKISIKGGATAEAVDFDGSGNVELDIQSLDVSKAKLGALPVARGGTGLGTVAAGSFLSGANTGALVPRTPAQVLQDIDALPKAGGEVSGPVLLGAGAAIGSQYGTANTSAQTAHIVLPDGAGASWNTSTITGAMKITLPPAAVGANTMLRFRVDVFEYRDSPPFSILVQGYVQTTRAWARCGATIIAGTPGSDMPIRFGSDASGRMCIWLGDLAKTWQYATVVISEVQAKYSSTGTTVAGWGTGWKIEAVTAFETVSSTLAGDNLAFARSDVARVIGLQEALDLKANASVQIVAGNGMAGGGNLASNRTLTLGTPSAITKASTNSVSATSHTHQLDITPADIGAASAASSVVAGNGMTGGGTLASSRTLSLGTPGSITKSSTNSVSAESHTHALSITPADIGAAPIASPAFTGKPTAPLPALGVKDNQVANTDFVLTAIAGAIANLIDSAPGALDTLKELATALGNDPNFAATMTNALAQKAEVGRQIVAGNGLTGGGTLAANRTLTLGTPGTLGASSTNAVQTSSHTHALDTRTSQMDATPGRILTVGAFGLGADNQLGTADLNTVTVPGKYGQALSANATPDRNYPTNKAGTLEVGLGGSKITTQTYIVFDTGEYYTRGCYNNVWSAEWCYHPGVARFPTATEARLGILRLATVAQAQALADDATALTPKKLLDIFNQGQVLNGSAANQLVPGGLIMKFGAFNGVAGTVNFATPFPTAALGVWGAEAAVTGADATDFVMFQYRGLDRFKFNPELRNKLGSYPAAAAIRYFAIGY